MPWRRRARLLAKGGGGGGSDGEGGDRQGDMRRSATPRALPRRVSGSDVTAFAVSGYEAARRNLPSIVTSAKNSAVDASPEEKGFDRPRSLSQPCSRIVRMFSPRRERLLRCAMERDWVIPPSYDFTRSTRDNYSSDSCEHYGDFKEIRATRDFSYHGHYCKERQRYQDMLIKSVVGAAVEKKESWIVFTAGAMGAGKSHVVEWMSNRGFFPLPDIVQIDPDVFKANLPEWDDYLERDPTTAGALTRLESGYLVEIAQEEAMRLRKNVWVDGSFRDAKWYSHVFNEIRKNHPGYKVAIIYVFASEETCLRRCMCREVVSGRHVPKVEIHDSLRRVPSAVEDLTPLADFVAHIENEADDPRLVGFTDNDGFHDNSNAGWEEVAKRFATLPSLGYAEQYRTYVQSLISDSGIVLFSKSYCTHAKKAQDLLQEIGANFRHIELDEGEIGVGMQWCLSKISGSHNLPQLYINARYLGGWEELRDMYRTGMLSLIVDEKCLPSAVTNIDRSFSEHFSIKKK